MKENYSRPIVATPDLPEEKNLAPFAAGVAMLGGYAAARAVTKAVKAAPSIKLPALPRSNHDI